MKSEKILSALKAASQASEGRSMLSRLRDVFDGVEASLAAGVSAQAVLEILNANGIEYTLGSLHTSLYRLRKERKQRLLVTGQQPVAYPTKTPKQPSIEGSAVDEVPANTPAAESNPPHKTGSHDPRDLDAIFSQRVDLAAFAKLAKSQK